MWLAHYPLTSNLNDTFCNDPIKKYSGSGSTSLYAGGHIGHSTFVSNWRGSVNLPGLSGSKQLGVSFWIMFPTGTTYEQTAWADVFSLDTTTGSSTTSFRLELTSTTDTTVRLNIYNNGIWTEGNGLGHITISRGAWHHICITADDTTLYQYVDGVFNNKKAKVSGFENATLANNTFYLGNSSGISFYIYDLRIFNNFISLKQYKEIYKTCIMHYKFNNTWEEPTTNLLAGKSLSFMKLSNPGDGTYNQTSQKISDYEYSITINQTSEGTAVKTLRILFPLDILTANTEYSLSFDIEVSDSAPYGLQATDWCDKALSNVTRIINGSNTHYEISGLTRSSYDATYRFLDLRTCSTIKNGIVPVSNVTFYLKNIIFEKKDHSTAFCETSRVGDIEDSSGFGNNGTFVGTGVSYSDDSPSGGHSCHFPGDGTSYIRLNPNMYGSSTIDQFTISYWLKNEGGNTGSYPTIFCKDGNPTGDIWLSYNCEGNNCWAYNGKYHKVGTNGATNVWDHYTFTFNNGTSTWYKNGVSLGTSTNLGANDNGKIIFSGGYLCMGGQYNSNYSWTTKFQGNLADIQIFAKELTAAEVKEVYENRASVDKLGNLYCGEINERVNHYEIHSYPTSFGINGTLPSTQSVVDDPTSTSGKALRVQLNANSSSSGSGFYSSGYMAPSWNNTSKFMVGGQNYIMSIWVRYDENSTTKSCDVGSYGNFFSYEGNAGALYKSNSTITTEWTRLSFAFKAPSSSARYSAIVFYGAPWKNGDILYFKDFMITDYKNSNINKKGIFTSGEFLEKSDTFKIHKGYYIKANEIIED